MFLLLLGLYIPAAGWAVWVAQVVPSSSSEMLVYKILCYSTSRRASITQHHLSRWTQIYLQSMFISFFKSVFPPQLNEVGCAPRAAQRGSGHSRSLRPCLNLGSDPSELPITMPFQAAVLISGASENSTAQMRETKTG